MNHFKYSLVAALGLATTVALGQMRVPAGYKVETIDIPAEITLGVGGLAFTPKNDLLISTREGEVWRYNAGKWSLFADGLHEALGLYVDQKTGEIWVIQRPEMTKLVDEDGDGKADLYQTVTAAWGLTDNYHEYAFGIERDTEGNFYGTLNTTLSWVGWAGSSRWDVGRVHDSKMGRDALYRGWSFQVKPDGTFVPWSAGMRSPAGLGTDMQGNLFYTDNQGDWNCTSSLQHIVKGRFHGHPSSLMDHPDFKGKDLNKITVEEYDKLRTRPALYFPHGELASSPGQPTWDKTDGKFGPFKGEVYIGDQTRSNMMRAWLEEIGGQWQGVVFDFIDPMQTGCIRNIFGPDGSMWVGQTGRGWRSVGGKMFGLQRVVWDGVTIPFEMHHVTITKTGFDIHFTKPVNREAAANPANYLVKRWHYIYQGEYGSPKVDETVFTDKQCSVSADGLVVSLTVPLRVPEVYQITLTGVTSASGETSTNPTGYYNANKLRD